MRSLVVLLVSLFVLAGRPACAADATELALETPVSGSVSKGGAPLLYCYTAPAFNVWRTFNEVNIEVAAPEGYIPNVHSASRDDLHGLVDGYVRGKEGDEKDVAEQARHRSLARSQEYFSSPADLLFECPPVWAPNSLACNKAFSPFGRSCVSVSARSDNATFVVVAKSSFNTKLPFQFAFAVALLVLARKLAKSKVLWYTSGISLTVLAGLMLILIYLSRRWKVPGSNSVAFSLVSITGYWFALGRYAVGAFRLLLIAHWEMVLGYCGVLAAIGVIMIARIRRDEARKHDFRILVLWSIRATGLILLVRSTRSGLFGLTFLFLCTVVYFGTRAIGKKGDPSKDGKAKSGKQN